MTTDVETYLNSLSNDILILNICFKGIISLPDLTRFKNLQIFNCNNNKLTYLPTLPKNLQILYCSNNKLTSLPTLPQNLKKLCCYNNELTSLPTLPQNLEELDCFGNNLTSLPTLPQNLKELYCSNNNLTSLPTLPQKLQYLYFSNNPICEILDDNKSLIEIKQKIQILNNFRYLWYCLKFKKYFRKWLWVKIREPKIQQIYDPIYLIENLKEEDDLELVLNNWK
jgi:Leucine-rich repeat (LRR) protein